jgi:hypothetical protein
MSVGKWIAGALTTRNVAWWDRILRIFPLAIAAYFIWTGDLTGPLAWVAAILGVMLALTSVLGSCSIYYMLGFSTCPISGKPR